jgi:hypothetical protein
MVPPPPKSQHRKAKSQSVRTTMIRNAFWQQQSKTAYNWERYRPIYSTSRLVHHHSHRPGQADPFHRTHQVLEITVQYLQFYQIRCAVSYCTLTTSKSTLLKIQDIICIDYSCKILHYNNATKYNIYSTYPPRMLRKLSVIFGELILRVKVIKNVVFFIITNKPKPTLACLSLVRLHQFPTFLPSYLIFMVSRVKFWHTVLCHVISGQYVTFLFPSSLLLSLRFPWTLFGFVSVVFLFVFS